MATVTRRKLRETRRQPSTMFLFRLFFLFRFSPPPRALPNRGALCAGRENNSASRGGKRRAETREMFLIRRRVRRGVT